MSNHASTPNKRVRFSDYSSQINFFPSSTNMKNLLWYDKQDLEFHKRTVATEVFMLREVAGSVEHVETLASKIILGNNNIISINSRDSVLKIHATGIEHMLSINVFNYIIQRRRLTISSVLREQESQKASGIRNEQGIADVSRINTKFSVSWASQIASYDFQGLLSACSRVILCRHIIQTKLFHINLKK